MFFDSVEYTTFLFFVLQFVDFTLEADDVMARPKTTTSEESTVDPVAEVSQFIKDFDYEVDIDFGDMDFADYI